MPDTTYDNALNGDVYEPKFVPKTGYPQAINSKYVGFSNNLTDPLRNFKFVVEIAHSPSGTVGGANARMSWGLGFMSVSGIAATTEAIPYREGGMNTTVHQLPGQTSFSPVTFQRGVTLGRNGNTTWQWFRQLFDVIAGGGTGAGNHAKGNQFRTDIDINVLEHPVTHWQSTASAEHWQIPVKMRVTLKNAWITGISYSDLNAGDNAIMVEQMTVVHEGFQIRYAGLTNGSMTGEPEALVNASAGPSVITTPVKD